MLWNGDRASIWDDEKGVEIDTGDGSMILRINLCHKTVLLKMVKCHIYTYIHKNKNKVKSLQFILNVHYWAPLPTAPDPPRDVD